MAHYKMVVLSNPVPGREQECDYWYQNVHLPELMQLPGFYAGQRFKLAHAMMVEEPYQYMAVYDIETDNIEAVMAELVAAADSGVLDMSDSLDRENAHAVVYTASGEPVRAVQV